MIHVDVRQTGEGYVVEASTDGAGFATQYVVRADSFEAGALTFPLARERAEDVARILAHGMSYAGGYVRITSCGNPLARI